MIFIDDVLLLSQSTTQVILPAPSFIGEWTPEERRYHINVLEMMARAFAVQSFVKDSMSGLHVHLRMDNTTAGVHQLPQRHALPNTGPDLRQWCLSKGITLSAEYVPGKENVVADLQSRLVPTPVIKCSKL